MNSRVKQAQKEGASVGDISSGLSYSVIKNALLKVIKNQGSQGIGRENHRAGGTFFSDAVLRSFELISGREAVRPDMAGLMGAYGAALISRDGMCPDIKAPSLRLPRWKTSGRKSACGAAVFAATTACSLSTVSVTAAGLFPETAARGEQDRKLHKEDIPNLFDYKYKLIFNYAPLDEKAAARGIIGIRVF
jgi:hypothetical protein